MQINPLRDNHLQRQIPGRSQLEPAASRRPDYTTKSPEAGDHVIDAAGADLLPPIFDSRTLV